MDAAFALESQEDQEAQMDAMRARIDSHEEQLEVDRLRKEKEDARDAANQRYMALNLQAQAREKKKQDAADRERAKNASQSNQVAFGSSTTVLAKMKKKALATKKAKEDKKRWDEQEKWNIYKEPLTGKQWKKTPIDDVLNDPKNFNGMGDPMSSPHVSNMDIDYELDLLEFEGICERERNLPVSKMR